MSMGRICILLMKVSCDVILEKRHLSADIVDVIGVGDYDMDEQPAVRPENPMRRDTASLRPNGEFGWLLPLL